MKRRARLITCHRSLDFLYLTKEESLGVVDEQAKRFAYASFLG
jgi:hypothetical protein